MTDNIVTHDILVKAGYRWLTKTIGSRFALTELRAATKNGEIPDIISWKSGYSVLIECKTSRSDFLSDKKKFARMYPEYGMGNFRLFLCPDELIKPDELPNNWGLLYYSPKRKNLKRIICWKGNVIDWDSPLEVFPTNYKAEVALLASYIGRLQ